MGTWIAPSRQGHSLGVTIPPIPDEQINRETALELARKWFDGEVAAWPHMANAAVDETEVIETSFAWILPWNDRRHLAGDMRYGIEGHSPVVVLKGDGTVMQLPKLTISEWTERKPQKLWGSMEDRVAKLAEKLGVARTPEEST